MADENDQERTQPASPRRQEEAREKGQVPQSRELANFTALAGVGAGLWLMGAPLVERIADGLRRGLTLERDLAFEPPRLLALLSDLTADALLVGLPFALLAAAAGMAAPLALRGWIFSTEALSLDLTRLDPIKGFGRMFSLRSVMELAVTSTKALLIGAAGAWALWSQREALISLAAAVPAQAVAGVGRALVTTLGALLGAMALVALADVPVQLWQHARGLRMSRDEVKRESKESDGDPQIKARIRTQQREASRRRMMAEVPKADVVVVNPTHYAVALAYQERRMGAPRVVAKGAALLAGRIREIAEQHRVPILQAPPLARALYHHAELGREIPGALYTAVAEVLAYVFHLRHASAAGTAEPPPPADIPVPPGMDPAAPSTGSAAESA